MYFKIICPDLVKSKIMILNLHTASKDMHQSCFDYLDIRLTNIQVCFSRCRAQKAADSREKHPMNSQPDVHYHGSSSRRYSMMSSQITVWSLWIVALSVACCSLKLLDVWSRLQILCLLFASSALLPTLPSFPFHSRSLQRAVAVWRHHGGWMCGCCGD